ncbi:MAG: Pre-mRNA-splicing factor SYF2 [Ramalina farinacea]|uniref:Pre-mRNA-splicing factor SYF2 n=1 Tax=Ramalina farinacea TaxID=258253 RepID=A0AA43QMB7_9LECA|nr:Pre-mRNA-splicing factor SYF2 [Ramalina farinacea]
MPPSKKRKISQSEAQPSPEPLQQPASPTQSEPESPPSSKEPSINADPPSAPETPSQPAPATTPTPDNPTTSRLARFKALQARAKSSEAANLKAARAESARLATDPNALTALQRKQALASHKLLKADTEAQGDDFERKRAWDWTIEESERWDRRMEKKERHREDVAFQDYTQDARKIYKRQLRELQPDIEGYEKQKAEAVQKAAARGGLEIVETEDGEVVVVEKSGGFYATADSTEFVENKPEKAAVDRLVKDLQKAEDVRLRKRRERGRENERDDGDVTFINDKNKQFNQKLARYYNKYTAEIRDSFERGTMI